MPAPSADRTSRSASSGWRRSATCRCSGSGCPRPSGRSRRSAGSSPAGGRSTLVDAGTRKELDLEVVVPVEDMRELGSTASLSHPVPADGQEMDAGTERGAQSIWPSIYPELLRLVEAHRSTIVFVNNRRLAERLALRLNELANEGRRDRARTPRLARARAARARRGGPESRPHPVPRRDVEPRARHRHGRRRPRDPGRVAEVGRARPAAHRSRGARARRVSKGRIFPKFRADLLESAVVARAMREGEIEETQHPDEPARRARPADRRDRGRRGDRASTTLHELVTRAYPFRDLSRAQFENVLDMLAGRYPSDEFAELRPRIVWDRTGGTIRARDGARRLAVTNAGTIPDRGLFGVFLVGRRRPRRRARRGDGLRGARGADVPARRVDLADRGDHARPGARLAGARCARRRAVLEGRGRRPAVRARRRRSAPRRASSSALTDAKAPSGCATTTTSTSAPRSNLLTFLREQQDATGVVPSDRTDRRRALPRRDRRLARLHPHAVRRRACTRRGRWRSRRGCARRTASRRSRSGRTTGSRCTSPRPTRRRRSRTSSIDPAEVEDLVVAELGDTALFGARFRENAARALLIPRRRPGERTPLWQQRLKAQSLLQVARKYGSFPVILETYRECLQDVFDLPALRGLLQGLQTRELDLVEVETQSASPYSASLLFDYIATYMYEDDTPPAERRAQALSLDRDLLRELLGQEELRDLLDARRAWRRSSGSCAATRARPTSCTTSCGSAAICAPASTTRARGAAARRAPRRARADRRRGAADRGRGRRAATATRSARCRRPGLPDAFLEGGPDSLRQLVLRFAKGRGPFTTVDANERFGRDVAAMLGELEARRAARTRRASSRAAPSASGATPTCSAACGARRSPRCGARSSPSSRRRSRASCRPGTAIDRRASLREALVPLQALPLPVALVGVRGAAATRPGLPARAPRRALRERRGRLDRRRRRPRRALLPRGRRRRSAASPARRRPKAAEHDALRAALDRGALFWHELLDETRARRGAPRCRRCGISSGRAR